MDIDGERVFAPKECDGLGDSEGPDGVPRRDGVGEAELMRVGELLDTDAFSDTVAEAEVVKVRGARDMELLADREPCARVRVQRVIVGDSYDFDL